VFIRRVYMTWQTAWVVEKKVVVKVGDEVVAEVRVEELTKELIISIAKEKGIFKFDVEGVTESGETIVVTPQNFDEVKGRVVELKILPRERAGH